MIDRFLGRFPLRFVLIVPFVTIILTTAGLIGYLGFRNGQRAANDLAAQLHDESTNRINQQLDSYLETPLLINNLNLDAIRLGQLDVNDQEAVKYHFVAQMQRFDSIVALTYAGEEPLYYVGTWRGVLGVDLGFSALSEETDYVLVSSEVTLQGEIGKQVRVTPGYDPRVRPWYQAAVQAGEQTWTPIYMWTSEDVGIDTVVPLYAEDGRLQGVLDTSLTLNGIGDFLQGAQVSEHGQTFIIDESGLLVASSTIREPYTVVGENVERLSALDNDDPLIDAAAQNLVNRFGGWTNIDTSQPFRFKVADKPQFAEVTPYQNNGLQWWIVVVIPESDFMAEINANNRNTLLLIGVSLTVSALVTTVLARRVTHPILQLNRASKALAAGQWSQKVVLDRRDEVGELAKSFNTMAEQQQALFASLQTSEKRFRTIFENSADAIAVSKGTQYIAVNPAYVKVFGYDAPEEIINQPGFNLIALSERERIKTYIRLRDQGEPAPTTYETRGLRRDGSEFDLENHISRYEMDGNGYTVSIIRDITERKQAEAALQGFTERLQILHEIDRAILSAETPQKIAAAALRHVRRLVPVQRVAVWIMDEQTNERVLLATIDDKALLVVGERHPLEKEWMDFFLQGEPLKVDDLRTAPQSVQMFSSLLEQGFLSIIVIPLMVQDKLTGALSLVADRPRACSDEHVQIAREVADQLAVAIRQAQLFEAERAQRTFAEALRDSTSAINRTLDLDDVLDRIMTNLERVVPSDAANLMLVQDEFIRFVNCRGYAERGLEDWLLGLRIPVSEWPLLQDVVANQRVMIVADTHQELNWVSQPEDNWIHSLISVPVIYGNQLFGFLNLNSATPGFFKPEHGEPLRLFADQAAIAIHNAELYQSEREQRVFAEALRDSASAINRTLTLDDVLDRILINVERVVPHDACNVMLIEGSTARIVRARGWAERGLGDWITTVSFGMDEIDRWHTRFAGEHPQPYTIADTHADPNWQMSAESEWIHSTAKAPLHIGGELIGILNLDSAAPDFFTQQHLDRLHALADQAVIAIRNAELYQLEHEQRILAETFRRMAEALSSTAQLDETLNLVIEQLAQIIHYDHAMVMLVEDENMRVVAARDRFRRNEIHDILTLNWQYSENSLFHRAMTNAQPTVINDTWENPLWSQMPVPVQGQTRSWIGMPLVVWGVTIGFLSIGSQHSHAYRANDVEIVKALAQQVALAIETSRVYAQLETSITSLRHAEANLAQAARLSVAGEIATSIAHQVNNPLTTIVAHTHLLLKRRTPDSPDYQSLETIRQAAYRAGSVVQRLLSFARPSAYTLQPVDINQSVEYAVSLVRAQIEPHLAHLIVELTPDLPMVNGSAQHLEDVWLNLILNARDAISGTEAGLIKISTALADNGTQLEIRVQDNGAGIAPDVLPRIFVPMFTTKARGTGLGLSVCDEVIQHHRGHIDVISQIGEGTTFIITLPCLS